METSGACPSVTIIGPCQEGFEHTFSNHPMPPTAHDCSHLCAVDSDKSSEMALKYGNDIFNSGIKSTLSSIAGFTATKVSASISDSSPKKSCEQLQAVRMPCEAAAPTAMLTAGQMTAQHARTQRKAPPKAIMRASWSRECARIRALTTVSVKAFTLEWSIAGAPRAATRYACTSALRAPATSLRAGTASHSSRQYANEALEPIVLDDL